MCSANAPSTRVLLVDDHRIVCAGVRMLIESQPGMVVIGEASCRASALDMAAREQPDLILFDLDLDGEIAIDGIPDLLAAAQKARVLVLTGTRDTELHCQAVRLGAMGIVMKEKATEVLLQAIDKVMAGDVWLERGMIAAVLGSMTRPHTVQETHPEAGKIARLTEREREVVPLVCEGLRNKQIAERLYITETTVRHHLTAIFAKLAVSDRLELVLYAYRHKLARPPG